MDPYETLGITPAYEGDLKALRNRLVKRHFEAGEAPDEERMKAINVAYELLRDRPPPVVVTGPLKIVTGTLDGARVGELYEAQPAASGGAPPYVWEGALPAGLTLRPTGAISGRIERPGSFPFTLRVTDRDGRTAERSVVVHAEPVPLRVLTETLPQATIGVFYEAQLEVAGGVAPLRWSGELPAGLQLGDGLLFGTPLTPSATFTVKVRDAARQTAFVTLRLDVITPAAEPSAKPDARARIAVAILLAAIALVLLFWLMG